MTRFTNRSGLAFRTLRLDVASFCMAAAFATALVQCRSSSSTASPTPKMGSPEISTPLPFDSANGRRCPSAESPTIVSSIHLPQIDEASGIAASLRNPDTFWIHNDSGDSARAFAVTRGGELRCTLTFDTAMPSDIEDMAIEGLPDGRSYLYFADIGDNTLSRDSVTIHRVAEPTLSASTQAVFTPSEKMSVSYPDGSHNAETLLFDADTKELFIATKAKGGPSDIHRVGSFLANGRVVTTKVATVQIPLATGGEISRDGRLVAIRNYTEWGFLWPRLPGESLASALIRDPCKIPIAKEKQGEAFGFSPDGKSYITTSEGTDQAIQAARFR